MRCHAKNVKIFSSVLLAVGAFSSGYAATEAMSSPFNITIPNLSPGFEANAGALWLKPGASNLNYVIYNRAGSPGGTPVQTPLWTERELTPVYSPAFQVGMRYVLPYRGQDISLNWVHLSTSDSASTTAPNASYFLGPDYQIGPDAIPIRNAKGNVKFRYDVVNLDAGQFVNFGSCLRMRFFGGLSGGFLREQVATTYTGEVTGAFAGPFMTRQSVYSNFTGIGPRAGMSAEYFTKWGVGFIGEAAASLLVGNNYSKTSFTSSSQELLALYNQLLNKQYIRDRRVYQVVPGFDAKLGVNYKYAFRDAVFTISAGYQGAVYVNAISQYLPGSVVEGAPIQTGGIYVATMNHTLSNYSVHGPFLNFAIKV